MVIEPEISSITIVLVGKFNPSIFQPFWFARNELVSETAAESADISVVHPDVSSFTIPDLFDLSVERNRFAISTSNAPLVLAFDIACRIFGDLLPHTPIGQLGINRAVHFNVNSESERDRIGRLLAPPEFWGEVGGGTSQERERPPWGSFIVVDDTK